MKYGLYGGMFDPPHLQHIRVAKEARAQLELDELIIVPAGIPVHRKAASTSMENRLELAQQAFRSFTIDQYEMLTPTPSPTIATLQRLQNQRPPGTWWLIVGADQKLETWVEYEKLRTLAKICVAPRGEYPIPSWADKELEMPALTLSSSTLRQLFAQNNPRALDNVPISLQKACQRIYMCPKL